MVESLGSLSFAISLWNDKEMASLPHSARATLCARQEEKLLKIQLNFFPHLTSIGWVSVMGIQP